MLAAGTLWKSCLDLESMLLLFLFQAKMAGAHAQPGALHPAQSPVLVHICLKASQAELNRVFAGFYESYAYRQRGRSAVTLGGEAGCGCSRLLRKRSYLQSDPACIQDRRTGQFAGRFQLLQHSAYFKNLKKK